MAREPTASATSTAMTLRSFLGRRRATCSQGGCPRSHRDPAPAGPVATPPGSPPCAATAGPTSCRSGCAGRRTPPTSPRVPAPRRHGTWPRSALHGHGRDRAVRPRRRGRGRPRHRRHRAAAGRRGVRRGRLAGVGAGRRAGRGVQRPERRAAALARLPPHADDDLRLRHGGAVRRDALALLTARLRPTTLSSPCDTGLGDGRHPGTGATRPRRGPAAEPPRGTQRDEPGAVGRHRGRPRRHRA